MKRKSKTKTLKFTLLRKGETMSFRNVVECIVSDELSRLSCYTEETEEPSFVADCDYEIIIRPKQK